MIKMIVMKILYKCHSKGFSLNNICRFFIFAHDDRKFILEDAKFDCNNNLVSIYRKHSFSKGFSLVEALFVMIIMSLLVVASMPVMTKLAMEKSGVDKNSMACIVSNAVDINYNTSTGVTAPTAGTPCNAAVTACQYNYGKACDTLVWQAEHGTTARQTAAQKILRATCDKGGGKACDWFIKQCRQGGSASCDVSGNFLDIHYYLTLAEDNSTLGKFYLIKELSNLVNKNVANIASEVFTDCPNLLTGTNTACTSGIATPINAITNCNNGNTAACITAYNSNYNQSCTQIKNTYTAAGRNALLGTYKISTDALGSTGSYQCFYNSGDGVHTFDFLTGTANSEIARLACQSIYGSGSCSSGSCGSFAYYYRTAGGSCSCSKPIGDYEWIYSNTGYSTIGNDYGGAATNITGYTTFTRIKTSSVCDTNSWNLALGNFHSQIAADPPPSTPVTVITSCNNGNATDCTTAYNNNYNRTCTQIKTAFTAAGQTATNGTYKITINGASSPASVTCDMATGLMSTPLLLGTYSYTGAQQAYTTVASGTYKLEAWGAQGSVGAGTSNMGQGGNGGYSFGDISLNSSIALYLYVGGQNKWNGGGPGGTGGSFAGGNGGDASDVRIGGTTLNDRKIVAAGGGGGGAGGTYGTSGGGGTGGGGTGTTGNIGSNGSGTYTGGYGGTSSSGGNGSAGCHSTSACGSAWGNSYGGNGILGFGGNGDISCNGTYQAGGGGGGGYYGGGGGGGCGTGSGGGGGSYYIGGMTANTGTTIGAQTGNGQIKIWLK